MKVEGEAEQGHVGQGERLSRLSEASLRINESLEFETVLREVLESARSLTDAMYGVITLIDEAGKVEALLSSGLTPEETRQLWNWSGGAELFEYLGATLRPLRLRDLGSHTAALGLPELRLPMPVSPSLAFLAAPVRHRGEGVGHFLPRREGRRRGVQPGRRRDPGPVRVPGGDGDRQCSKAPGRAARPKGPADSDRHLPCGHRCLRCPDRRTAIVQQGGREDRGSPEPSRRGGPRSSFSRF